MQNNAMENSIEKPKSVAYGAASLTRVLHGVDFPITKNQIIEKYGHKEVSYSKGSTKTMAEIVSRCDTETFYTMAGLVEACAKRPVNNHCASPSNNLYR
jgi:hypothetical protein